MNRTQIVVLGGGITGLSAAHRLRELAAERGMPIEITLLERSPRIGGCVQTRCTGGFTMELGPDSLLTEKPAAMNLVTRLGLKSAIEPMRKGYRGRVLRDGRLVPIPDSFRFFTPTSLAALAASGLFSFAGIARAALEPTVPRKLNDGDESLSSFVTRRFGREVLERLAQPLVGGIYSGDPEELSMKATLPQMLRLEQKYGSLVRGMRATMTQTNGTPAHRMVTLRGGLGTLTAALEESVRDNVRVDADVLSLQARDGTPPWTVRLRDGSKIAANAVICALPAHEAARLIASFDQSLAAMLKEIRYHSVATVNLAYETALLPPLPECTGFLVPAVEHRAIAAVTFSSQKYDGRSPDGYTLLRVFVGGAVPPPLLSMGDREIIDSVRRELSDLLGIRSAPRVALVHRFDAALPQYSVGHVELVDRIDERVSLNGTLALAGSAFRGAGIADCVHSGESAAQRLFAEIADGRRLPA